MIQPLFTGADWSHALLAKVTDEIARIADEELKLDYFPMHICTITAEQMLDAYAMNGMPTNYAHWSYGKRFLVNRRGYDRGQMGLAYEIVINTNPCLVYCMEENSMTMQTLVVAHAGFGHNHFFKNNHLFKQWTDPSSIVDYLKFARDLVAQYEEEHGVEEVQDFLSACHAWALYGIDRYKRPRPLSVREEKERMRARAADLERNLNVIWRFIPSESGGKEKKDEKDEVFPKEPQENILYFIEKNAPSLPIWKRELIRIVRKEAQYFYPQMLTKMMNEGFATFTHHYIMNRLHEKGLITEGSFQEFLVSHTNVIKQTGFDETVRVRRGTDPDTGEPIVEDVPIYRGVNPYALGFAMFQDIQRICESPTEEDRRWFPQIAGMPWVEGVKWASENFVDKTFIEQYLSPKVIRDFKLFAVKDDDREDEVLVSAIHDDDGYQTVRDALANMYDLNTNLPAIQVVNVDRRGSRMLTLKHDICRRRFLDRGDTEASLMLLHQLWEYPVSLHSVSKSGSDVEWWECEDGKDIRHRQNTDMDYETE